MATSTHPRQFPPGVVPDGIASNSAFVRRRGGLIAVVIATGMAVVGFVLIWLPGPIMGVLGFLLVNAGLPVLALTGIPAVSGADRFLIAIVASAVLWWGLGHFAAVRASRRAIVDWKEWRREFQPLAIGVWVGSVLALGVAAFVLGAL